MDSEAPVSKSHSIAYHLPWGSVTLAINSFGLVMLVKNTDLGTEDCFQVPLDFVRYIFYKEGAFMDYCTSLACKFVDHTTREKYFRTKRRAVDDDTTQPMYIPPSRLHRYKPGTRLRKLGTLSVFTVQRISDYDDCYELVSDTGYTHLRLDSGLVEKSFVLEEPFYGDFGGVDCGEDI